MSRPVFREWSGEKLVYVSPRAALNKVGYISDSQRGNILPAEEELFASIEAHVQMQDGEPAAERQDLGTPAAASARIKSLARELGADMVGIAPVDPKYVYDGFDGIDGFAVVFAIAMDYEGEILKLPRPETNVEYIRVYELLSRLGVDLAQWIRDRGYPARAHTLRDEQLAMLPHAYTAGLGELGKHGSLINRELGCAFRLGVVTTELALAVDSPREEGIQDFCRSCRMCVSYCPGDAISDEMDIVRDTERWIVDTEKCAPYFSHHFSCAVCLQVCPINAKAFGGQFKEAYVQKMRELDPARLTEELSASVPPPWTEIDRE
jgi:epoxyqueuosine reductase QueG